MVIGKSNLFRKKDMEHVGGLLQYAKYMSEDNEIGKSIMNLGKKHQIAPEFAYQSMGKITFKDFVKRRIRWIRIRKYVVLLPTVFEPFCECFFHAFLAAKLYTDHIPLSSLTIFSTIILIWFCSDMLMMLLTYSPTMHRPRDIYGMVTVWFLRESIALLIWIFGMIGTEIQWRGTLYHCNSDGTGTSVDKNPVGCSEAVGKGDCDEVDLSSDDEATLRSASMEFHSDI
jgi:ceramide glucosyltransferase